MSWRNWNQLLHRDIGFLCVGLTIVYAVSGVAVNHIHQWNPSYSAERSTANIGPVAGDPEDLRTAQDILGRLGDEGKLESRFRPAPDQLQLFVDRRSILVELSSGQVVYDRAVPRPLLRAMNFLHLNHPKKAWTWLADLYAVALGFLAVSGLLMLRRKNLQRGLLLTAIGILTPLAFLWLYL